MLRLLGVRFTGDLRPDIERAQFGERRPWDRALADFLVVLTERRRVRSAERELESMDDYLLRDIGLSRSEITPAVRYGRGYSGRSTSTLAGWRTDKEQ